MDLNKLDKEKMFFTIGEVAKLFDVNTSLIRFWEKEFDIISPKKNPNGNRKFTRKDIYHFKIIYNLVKEKKFTLEGAKEKLKTEKKQFAKKLEIRNKLIKIKDSLEELKSQNNFV